MRKKTATIFITIGFVLIMLIGLRFLSGEDDWICQDGQWVKHGQPSNPMPNYPCPQ